MERKSTMMTSKSKNRRGRAAVASALLGLGLVLTACSGESAVSDNGSGLETTEISVGALPFADVAPLHIAVEDGLFEAEGLDVTILDAANGAAQVPALISGDVHFSYASYVATLQGVTKGLPLQVVRDNNRNSPQGIYVPGNSPIEKPKDLEGTTVALNSLASIQEITSKAVLESLGVDITTVKFIELPPANMMPALEQGNIDAAFLVEPFLTMGVNDDYREIMNAWQGPTENFPIAGWVASKQFVAQNPNTVDAFVRAMDKATSIAAESPERIADVIPTYTAIPEDIAGQVAEKSAPGLAVTSDLSDLGDVAALMSEWGLLEAEVNPDEVVYSPSS